jgi:DNA-binding transcriptional MerR regulator
MREGIPDEMKLSELAEIAGIPARTIRLYISRGVLDGPSKLGRGASYGRQHVERLEKIREMQSKGLTLSEIGRKLARGTEQVELPAAESWASYPLASDVVVFVRGAPSPWRQRQIMKALSRLASDLKAPEKEGQDEHSD